MKAAWSMRWWVRLCTVVLLLAGLSACQKPADDGVVKAHMDSPTSPISSSYPVMLEGWVISRAPIQGLDVSVDGQTVSFPPPAIARPDVLASFPDLKGVQAAGFQLRLNHEKFTWDDIHQLKVEAVSAQGTRHTIGETTVIGTKYQRPVISPVAQRDIFYVLFATSGAAQGGLHEIIDIYRPLESSSIKVGIRVPILYLRTTRGRAQDWTFDPDFDTRRQCGDKTIAEDSLNSVIQTAIKLQLPVLFTLNGGVWADARCDVPDWDINDELEKDPLNSQWDSTNTVRPDDYLQHLPGSENSPELARTLTFNVYASKVRQYKKRNLQQAAGIIRNFQLQHPELFVGVTLDPDVYVNPFFESPSRLHDYNPKTVQQFREWLQGTGPYGPTAAGQAPGLHSLRHQPALSLQQINALSGQQFASWDAVDPPRPNPAELVSIFLLPERQHWFHIWEVFRRHLVDVHYDDLSRWVNEAGVDARYIQSAQGMHENFYSAIPERINSPLGRYDTGGASIEGAVPSNGHLGVIVYGDTAQNISPHQRAKSLFATFRDFDADWGIVEFNTADLKGTKGKADFPGAYRSMRDSFNYGARYVSPMAWNGSNGIYVKQADFVPYTSVRNTPLDVAIRRLMRTNANLPRGSKFWTFGTHSHPDSDGWTVNQKPPHTLEGGLELASTPDKQVLTLESPPELSLSNGSFDLWLQDKSEAGRGVDVIEGRISSAAPWVPLQWKPTDAKAGRYQIQLDQARPIDQIRIRIQPGKSARLEAVELRLAQSTK